MTTKTIGQRWIVGAIVAIALLACVGIVRDAMANDKDVDALRKRILEVAKLSGPAYQRGREGLELLYKKQAERFAVVRNSTDDWSVGLLCSIVSERVEKENAVRAFTEWQPLIRYSRLQSVHMAKVGEALAHGGKETPMLLVEKLWKDNEIKKWKRHGAGEMYVIYALSLLGAKQSRPVLEDILTPDYFELHPRVARKYQRPAMHASIRAQAAIALGKFGDPRSVPALVEALDDEGYAVAKYATEALLKCADERSVPFLERALDNTKDEGARESISSVLKEIKAKEQSEKK